MLELIMKVLDDMGVTKGAVVDRDYVKENLEELFSRVVIKYWDTNEIFAAAERNGYPMSLSKAREVIALLGGPDFTGSAGEIQKAIESVYSRGTWIETGSLLSMTTDSRWVFLSFRGKERKISFDKCDDVYMSAFIRGSMDVRIETPVYLRAVPVNWADEQWFETADASAMFQDSPGILVMLQRNPKTLKIIEIQDVKELYG